MVPARPAPARSARAPIAHRPGPRPGRSSSALEGAPDEGLDLVRDGEELVAGRHPVEEALAARRQAHRLLVVPHRREALERIVLHATTLRIPIVEVEGGTLTAIAGFDGHQGVAVVVAARRFASLEDVLARAIERGEPPFVLALDSLEDPQNLGSLLRSAEAAGVHGVLFPTKRQAPLTPAAVKASAGAVEHLLLVPVDDLAGALADLHVRGLRVAGAEADAALTHREADLRGPVVLVVGHEGQGLGPAVRRRCDLLVRIPMHGRIASLNAAVAGSILLFEAAGRPAGPTAPEPPPVAMAADVAARRGRASCTDGERGPSGRGSRTAPSSKSRRSRARRPCGAAAEPAPATGVPVEFAGRPAKRLRGSRGSRRALEGGATPEAGDPVDRRRPAGGDGGRPPMPRRRSAAAACCRSGDARPPRKRAKKPRSRRRRGCGRPRTGEAPRKPRQKAARLGRKLDRVPHASATPRRPVTRTPLAQVPLAQGRWPMRPAHCGRLAAAGRARPARADRRPGGTDSRKARSGSRRVTRPIAAGPPCGSPRRGMPESVARRVSGPGSYFPG